MRTRSAKLAWCMASAWMIIPTVTSTVSGDCTGEWLPVNGSVDGSVTALQTMSNGDVVAGGGFTTIEGTTAQQIARWNGTSWSALGDGLYPAADPWPLNIQNRPVATILERPNGDLFIGGADFAVTSGGSKNIVAQWNGSAWSEFSPNIRPYAVNAPTFMQEYGLITSMVALPNGDVLAGAGAAFFPDDPDHITRFLLRWDGAQWTDSGSTTQDIARTMIVLPDDGKLAANMVVVGGGASSYDGVPATGGIAYWDGTSTAGDGSPMWHSLNFGTNGVVNALLLLPNGDFIAAGTFLRVGNSAAADLQVNRIARFNRTTNMWERLGSGLSSNVYTLAVLPNGDIIAGGRFTVGTTIAGETATPAVSRIARWDGAAWSPMGTGVNNDVLALAVDSNGDLLVGGKFTTVNGSPSANFARWGCPEPVCLADFNTVNGVTVQDIFDFLTAWLAGNTSADFNGVNGVTVQDIFDFLTAWLAGC